MLVVVLPTVPTNKQVYNIEPSKRTTGFYKTPMQNHFMWIIVDTTPFFILEVLKVERSDEYEKELWQLNAQQRIDLIPTLREKGNKLYVQKMYKEAEEAYNEALAICEQLMIR